MKILLLAALAALLLGSCMQQEKAYRIAIHVPNYVTPIYCDSVEMDRYCIEYWQDGTPGWVCGDYQVNPL